MNHIIEAVKKSPVEIPEGSHYALIWFDPSSGQMGTLHTLDAVESILAATSLRLHGEGIIQKAHANQKTIGNVSQ